ncbi:hypothetical protein CCACVL1_29221 [Corchorus capsularis]|uniref:Uncharacterized protein n=1 Tax=Corchorus capsularis TaxID=210143 RepID=A0A1R3G2Z2_COCAP|nr:hypothetical protein CCACVL1_29221 [Corchorus capsularis]
MASAGSLEALVERRVTGFPVIDDDWTLLNSILVRCYLSVDIMYLATTSATKVYIDLDIPETRLIRRRFDDYNEAVKILKANAFQSQAKGSKNEPLVATVPISPRESCAKTEDEVATEN